MKKRTVVLFVAWFILIDIIVMVIAVCLLSMTKQITVWPVIPLAAFGLWIVSLVFKMDRRGEL